MTPEQRFERIEARMARLDADVEKQHRIFMSELARSGEEGERKHRIAMARMDRMDEKHEKAMDRIDAALKMGARLIAKNAQETRALKAEVRAYIRGRNGHRGLNGKN